MNPWDRQPSEPDDAWEVFQTYRDRLSARRIDGLFPGKSTPQMRREWFQKYAWRERTMAYDAYIDHAKTEEVAKSMATTEKAINAELAEKLTQYKAILDREMAKVQLSSEATEMPIGAEITPLTRALKEYFAMARLLSGQTTENIGQGEDYSAWSIDDLRTLRKLRDKYKVRT